MQAKTAQDKAGDYTQTAKDKAGDLTGSTKDTAGKTQDTAGDYAQTAKDKASSAADTLGSKVCFSCHAILELSGVFASIPCCDRSHHMPSTPLLVERDCKRALYVLSIYEVSSLAAYFVCCGAGHSESIWDSKSATCWYPVVFGWYMLKFRNTKRAWTCRPRRQRTRLDPSLSRQRSERVPSVCN